MAQPITIPDCAKKLLEFLYPTVDWSRVTFFSGLPWWVASGTTAITIPDPLSALGYRVYLGANTNFCDDATINTIVHESFHLQQFMGGDGGYGLGFVRWGFFNYFVCHFANGYDNNPFEQQAYAQEKAFRLCHTIKVCDCKSGKPEFNPAALDALAKCNSDLVIRKPTTPSCASSWWAFLLALIVVPILAILVFIAHLIDLLNCTYLQSQMRQCIEWAQQTREQCNEWADQGYQQCNQWADQGYQQCNQWADQGYSTCSQWADQGYNVCCDWWPCSWLCDAFVWITNIVCVLTIWITNMVCVLSVWIANVVCVVSVWIANVVCILWVTIIEMICVVWIVVIRTILFCWWR